MPVKAEHVKGDRYRVRVYDGHRRRQLTRTYRAPSQREANRLAAKYEDELRQRVKWANAERGTVARLVAEWQEENDPTASAATVYRRAPILRSIVEHLGPVRLDELGAKHVDRWLNALRREDVSQSKRPNHPPRYRSEATVHHYFRQLRAVLNQGEAWGDVNRVVTRQARKPVVPRRLPPDVDRADAAKLIDSAGEPLRTIARFAARTGMRLGEICALRWSDLSVTADGAAVQVVRSVSEVPGRPLTTKPTKTGVERVIALDAATEALLAEHLARVGGEAVALGSALAVAGPMFPAPMPRDGSALLSPSAVSHAWRSHCRKTGVSGVRFHDLRHLHATALLNDGQPLHAVSRRMGHSLPSTTQNIYGHRETGADRALATRAAELLP